MQGGKHLFASVVVRVPLFSGFQVSTLFGVPDPTNARMYCFVTCTTVFPMDVRVVSRHCLVLKIIPVSSLWALSAG